MPETTLEFVQIHPCESDLVYAEYKSALFPVIENTFGWNEDIQLERFTKHYKLDCFYWIEASKVRIGFICYFEKASEIHLSLLIINSKNRNCSYGQLAMSKIHELAILKRFKVTLSSFRSNIGAIKFYERLGYKTIGGDEHFIDMALEAL